MGQELLEAIRKSKGSEHIVEEMADVIIRLLDVYAAMRNEEQILHSLDEVLEIKIIKKIKRLLSWEQLPKILNI